MAIRTIEQKITAGSQFTGAAPTTTMARAYDMERYPTDTVGGLVDFANPNPIQIKQIFIKFGGQASWTLKLIDVDNVKTTLLSGTNETYLANLTLGLILFQGQKLELVTVAATTAMVVRVSATTRV